MIVIEVEQRSPLWHQLRKNKIGASECAAVLGKSTYTTPYMLWNEKMWGVKREVNAAMQRGIDLEPEAVLAASKSLGMDFHPIVVQHPEYPWMIASLDGWNDDRKVVLEIKTPGAEVFEKAKDGIVSPDYQWQIQHQLACTGATQGFLSFYYCAMTLDIPFLRDEEMIEELISGEKHFYEEYILGFEEPPRSDKDVRLRLDEAWVQKAGEYAALKQKLDPLMAEEKKLREELIDLAGDESCEGSGITLTRYSMAGRIDYGKIRELEGVNLESYRKPASIAWRASVKPSASS